MQQPEHRFLGELTAGRDNNLNLIRFLAAFAVLISHSFPLALGEGAKEPLGGATGITIGTMAVDIFFVTSGFLVTGSLLTRASLVDFTLSRILRIYPALIAVVITTIVGGLFISTLPVVEYLTHPQLARYLIINSTMLKAEYELPGVFGANPYPKSVNGSLWTLPWELRMYVLLAVLWAGSHLFGSRRRSWCEAAIVLIGCSSVGMLLLPKLLPGLLPSWLVFGKQFLPAFFIGGAFYVMRAHIKLVSATFWGCIVALVVSGALLTHDYFFVVYFLTMPYALLYAAFMPRGRVRRFNRLGDYSYGIYIWAFPVQQTVAFLVPGISVHGLILVAAPVTLVLAWCSWHLIEHRSLRMKEPLMLALRKLGEQKPNQVRR
jgi:peptidoglycan/LPS O-acetylase OafA/YrhL